MDSQLILDGLKRALAGTPIGPDGRPNRNYQRQQRLRAEAELRLAGVGRWEAKKMVNQPSKEAQK